MSESSSTIKKHEEQRCVLCRSSADDDSRFGPKYKLEELVVHYFCLLFACSLIERGKEDEGILGFLKNDIIKEVKRAKFLKCVFCKENGAACGCCIPTCKVALHYPCGLDNGVLSIFKSPNYHSYCIDHRQFQEFEALPEVPTNCKLCSSLVRSDLDRQGLTFIQAPCCKLLIHRYCLQRNASFKSLDTFKCPNCEDPEGKFLPEMRDFGIYIPKVILPNRVGVNESQVNVMKSDDCDLCATAIHDELRLGPKYQLGELDVHYFCLLFACGLTRSSADRNVGILGFLEEDIKYVVVDAKDRMCVFCNEMGATSNCCQSGCQVSFHYPCGLENGVLSLFKSNQYDTYCLEHRTRQRDIDNVIRQPGIKCAVCNRRLEPDPMRIKFLLTPCCGRIFHRLCLQKRALKMIKERSSFNCPCNTRNEGIFIREMVNFGLYVPGYQAYLVRGDENQNTSSSLGESVDQGQDFPMDESDDSTHEPAPDEELESDMTPPFTSSEPNQMDDIDHGQNYSRDDLSGVETPQINQLPYSGLQPPNRNSERINDGAGSSWMHTDQNIVPKTEKDQEIEYIKRVENSREGPFQIAVREAKRMLPSAFVQQNGRIRTKTCKVCGYFTLAEGPSSYEHQRSQHRSLMSLGEDLFEEDEHREEVTILTMARQILQLDQS